MRCEERSLDDIRALGGHEADDERLFATVAHISAANLALYRTFFQPIIRACMNPVLADWMRKLHPLRLQYELLNDESPIAPAIAEAARLARENRSPASQKNPFVMAQEIASQQIAGALDGWGKFRDSLLESIFFSVYGSPALEAAAGIDPSSHRPLRKAPKSSLHLELLKTRIAELRKRIEEGGLLEAAIRGLLYAGSARSRIDERGVNTLLRMRRAQDRPNLTLSQFKTVAREQFYLLQLDAEAAIAAIPQMLPANMSERRKAFDAIREILAASEELSGETDERLLRVQRLFGLLGDGPETVSKAGRKEPDKKTAKPKESRVEVQSAAGPSGNGRNTTHEHH